MRTLLASLLRRAASALDPLPNATTRYREAWADLRREQQGIPLSAALRIEAEDAQQNITAAFNAVTKRPIGPRLTPIERARRRRAAK